MARVRCITMQRDEDVLLEPWLRWHGYLFGFENLFVFDNGSTSPRTLATLAFYEQLGVEVRRDLASGGDFHGKGFHFANVIRHWDSSGDYDYVFPIDCDEFVAVFTPDGISCGRVAIHAHLEAIGERRFALDAGTGLLNVPGRPGWFTADRTPKRFLARGTVAAIDFGNNAITSVHAERTTQSGIVYLHHHFRAHGEAGARARRNLASFVDVDDPDSLRRYQGPGLHLVPHLSVSERDYLRPFDAKTLLRIPGWSLLLRALGVTDPLLVDATARREDGLSLRLPGGRGGGATIAFSGAEYLALHPDLQNGDVLPLQHYLAFGINEGRAPGGAPPAAPSVRPRARGRVTTS